MFQYPLAGRDGGFRERSRNFLRGFISKFEVVLSQLQSFGGFNYHGLHLT